MKDNSSGVLFSQIELSYQDKHEITFRLKTPEDVALLFRILWHQDFGVRERLYALYLNSYGMPLGYTMVSAGSLTSTIADCKLILQYALQSNCNSLLLGHNHVSGSLAPSEMDRKFTNNMREAGKIMGIPLVDHYILTRKSFYRIQESDLLQVA